MARKFLSWAILAICEAAMIAAFVIYRGEMETSVMVMDILICSIILGLFFIDIVRPWSDEHTAKIGSMGVRWTLTIVYAVLALGAMVLMRNKEFSLQIIIQGVLVAVLLLGLVAALRTKEQIVKVHEDEQQKVGNRDSVKQAWSMLLEKMEMQSDFPPELKERTVSLVEDMRYLSPTNGAEAMETDRMLIECAEEMSRMLGDYRLNAESAGQLMSKSERLLQRRRTQFSK
ncbi:MAG: hypothetical protein J5526_06770 [Bacteroidales bacterium]|nr:hypothetical protein [Bacteroidales bacterium]